MKKWVIALGTCATLSMLPLGAFADHYDAGDAVLGGIIGGVVGGLIGSVVAPYPAYVEPYWPPGVVRRYGPPVVVYGDRPYRRHHHYRYDRRGYDYDHHDHHGYRRHWDDD